LGNWIGYISNPYCWIAWNHSAANALTSLRLWIADALLGIAHFDIAAEAVIPVNGATGPNVRVAACGHVSCILAGSRHRYAQNIWNVRFYDPVALIEAKL
jgi:hypothetical protein